jgi:hypothetical protein
VTGGYRRRLASALGLVRSQPVTLHNADEVGKAGSSLQVVEARSGVRDRLHGEGLDARLGGINRFMTVGDALDRL